MKKIGIASLPRYEVLSAVLHEFIVSEFDKKKCILHINEFTKSPNRVKKCFSIINSICKNYILSMIKQKIKNLTDDEIKALVICLLSIEYPIIYDILSYLGSVFKVQPFVSRNAVMRKITSMYGSNASVGIAVSQGLAFLIEIGFIQRMKKGIYAYRSGLNVSNKAISELILYADIKSSGSKSLLIDDFKHRSWQSYFYIDGLNVSSVNIILTNKDSAIGNGYVTCKKLTP